MKKVVYKYGVETTGEFTVNLPLGAEILTVQIQSEIPFMWALVDPDAKQEPRRFRLVGTGHPINNGALTYIDTFQLQGGRLIFHLFEIKN